MAGDEGQSEGALVKSSNKCGFCPSNVAKPGVTCKVCNTSYHASCVKRARSCCGSNLIEMKEGSETASGGFKTYTQSCSSSPSITFEMCEYYKMEISYLRSLLEEKENRIKDLIKINVLQEEKIKNIEKLNISSNLEFVKQKTRKDGEIASKSNTAKNVDKKGIQTKNIYNKDDADKRLEQDKNKQRIINKQVEVMNDLINIEKSPAPNLNSDKQDDDSEFRLVVHKRRNKNNEENRTGRVRFANTTIGTGATDSNSDFKARPRKMWLYVGRANENVKSNHVENYIKTRCGIENSDELSVRELAFLGRSPSFQVGVDAKYFDMINTSEFWPSGILIRRFNFKFNQANKNETSQSNFLGHPMTPRITD